MFELHKAVKDGYLNKVQHLLNSGVNVNEKDPMNNTPLHEACFRGDEFIFKKLLKRNDIDVNVKGMHDMAPLHIACLNYHESIVEELLKRNDIDVNIETSAGMTPLHFACFKRHESIVKKLLKHDDIDVNVEDERDELPDQGCDDDHIKTMIQEFRSGYFYQGEAFEMRRTIKRQESIIKELRTNVQKQQNMMKQLMVYVYGDHNSSFETSLNNIGSDNDDNNEIEEDEDDTCDDDTEKQKDQKMKMRDVLLKMENNHDLIDNNNNKQNNNENMMNIKISALGKNMIQQRFNNNNNNNNNNNEELQRIEWNHLEYKDYIQRSLNLLMKGFSVDQILSENEPISSLSKSSFAMFLMKLYLVVNTCRWNDIKLELFEALYRYVNESNVLQVLKSYLLFIYHHENHLEIPDRKFIEGWLLNIVHQDAETYRSITLNFGQVFDSSLNIMKRASQLVFSSSSPSWDETLNLYSEYHSIINSLKNKSNQRENNLEENKKWNDCGMGQMMNDMISFCERHIEDGAFFVLGEDQVKRMDVYDGGNTIKTDAVANGADVIITSEKNDDSNDSRNQERLFLVHSELLKVWSLSLYNLCTHSSFSESQNKIKRLSTNEDILECIIRYMYTADPLKAIQQSILKKASKNNNNNNEDEITMKYNMKQLIRLWNECRTWNLNGLKQRAFDMIKKRLNDETWLITDAVETVRNELRINLDLDEDENNNLNNMNMESNVGANEMRILLKKTAQEKMNMDDVKDLVIQRILFMN